MEGGSEVEKMKPPEGGDGRSKRKMKTASQLEILEKTYAVEQYPPEAMRGELSVQLGLTDRQLQMWFCHRRLKDRKARQPKESPIVAAPDAVAATGADVVSGTAPGPSVGPSSLPHSVVEPSRAAPRVGTAVARISRDFPPVKRYYEPQVSVLESRVITFVEAQLGEPLREDGPLLGMEFDQLPPDAFGAGGLHKPSRRIFEAKYDRPDAKLTKGIRPVQEYQFLPEKPAVRSEMHERAEASYILQVNEQVVPGHTLQGQLPTLDLLATPSGRQGQQRRSDVGEYAADPRENPFMDVEVHGVHPIMLMDPLASSDRRIAHNEEVLQTERKRKSDEARIARELEANEKRIRKELKRQDILRRKRDEQIRKDMERHDRERRKEEERLLREKQREEERYLREQRREVERREKFLLKESMKAEKMRQKEEVRRMKEAARVKAASERAIARRIAKESMELMEDARLELMEIAASSKGLASIASLDYETLQNLDLFSDSLSAFPPRSVPLKRPFAIQPWLHSEENVANLLMVWRFLITFADVLQIWPFTLDEFVQAFHDYDSRLLSEIHISLLKLIIKDIEDVARTPSLSLGANQNVAANPGGGHPHVVEGAYTWGFDIRSWQRHLNPLTWPEILRQFALSAGFGPENKKKNAESMQHYDDAEVNDGENVISILRDGTAAENAFAKMQERGYSSLRRTRHRLTPGTVKFAAFHILSIEGSEGLNILEVADKIQKSGLRDLSSSRTPEASIAAALSRDTKLFERTAPSTYCVRDAYRKDPADAEAVLSAARERIRTFKREMMEGEEEAEDAERDEDSESVSGEDPEIDDLATELNLNEEICPKSGNNLSPRGSTGNGIESDEIRPPQMEIPQSGPSDVSGGLNNTVVALGKESGTNDGVAIKDEGIENNLDEQETDIDESIRGEPWVEGLMEGEYADLSVEERLGALVTLIGVASEGNTIRLVLEERLEVATALKKQMWAEAQLDKRRFREDYVLKTGYPSQTSYSLSTNGKQSPSLAADDGRIGLPVDPSVQQEQMIRSVEENQQILDNFGGSEVLSLAQAGYAAERSRSQLKSFIGYKVEQMYVYRSLPLGQDRRRNRYWLFATSASRSDPGCGRIFVELRDGCWRLIDSEEGFDALLAVLDIRGTRESNLHSMLRKIEPLFKEIARRNSSDAIVKKQAEETLASTTMDSPYSGASETSTSFLVELPRERNGALRRYQDFENWIWRECLSSPVLCAAKFGNQRSMELLRGCIRCHEVFAAENGNCPSCHGNSGTFAEDSKFPNQWLKREDKQISVSASSFNLGGSVSSPVRIRLLKVQLSAVEACIPPEAVADVWTNPAQKSWGAELTSSSSAGDLLQALTLLECAVKRDYLSSKFDTTSGLLSLSHPSSVLSDVKNVQLLPWVPKTTAAVALRLMELDSAIFYTLDQKVDSLRDEAAQEHGKLSLQYAAAKNNTPGQGIADTLYRNDPFGEDSWVDSGGLLGSSSRGRGGRGRTRGRTTGLRSQRTVGSRVVSRKTSERSGDVPAAPRGRPRGRGGRKRGRRSVRNRQKAPMRATQKEVLPEKVKPAQFSAVNNDWNDNENEILPLEESENSSSSERFEYGVENGQEIGYEYDDAMVDNYNVGFAGKSDDLMEGNAYEEEDEQDDEEEEEEEEEELGVEGYVDGQDSDEMGIRGDGFGIDTVGPEEDAAAYTTSSYYSDEDDS